MQWIFHGRKSYASSHNANSWWADLQALNHTATRNKSLQKTDSRKINTYAGVYVPLSVMMKIIEEVKLPN